MLTLSRSLRPLLSLLLATLLVACSSTPAPVTGPTPAGHYRVKAGDTLYRIARANRQSVSNLVRWNGLKSADAIEVGQLLRVSPPDGSRPSSGSANTTPRPTPTPTPSSSPAATPILLWPGDGALLYRYDGQRRKGIGIAATSGSPVKAAAAGKVVYTGDGIRSYGLLLIIKHSNGLLTTYAHNAKLLVKEGQQVEAGQTIAQAGSTGTDRIMIHFEVRRDGKAVDPLPWLPER
ncbi:peptidoglycan DD-metalloendopeptidase family protein [Chitinilyticum piscinae]|uniref:Peptidoglycan DD-metalloendopeptidase family protein n=1 Tax=Chitinilyticum piscinae TaxID=2866724 RepID=A0A8J7K252_9NEIS|nr:peptidoglycan DD-metalloendopeptidase family protein [Chitinilyticum piscinae]MBE9610091.1 peptidoglycan DD-metalloendopeptidase family protein [Chitinilyticum piscinae]